MTTTSIVSVDAMMSDDEVRETTRNRHAPCDRAAFQRSTVRSMSSDEHLRLFAR